MNRHYRQPKLKHPHPYQRLNTPAIPVVWKLSPYEVARFSGELLQVMGEAAQKYIYEKSLAEIKKDFQREILNSGRNK
ncbi:MAG: hypothetical protein ACM3X9_00375 [Bacillota bacterium]